MNSLITPAIVSAAFEVEFATIGIRAASTIVATIRTAAKLAGVKMSDVSKDETRALALDIAARLTAKGCTPCDKKGAPYNKRDMAGFISDCVRTAYGQKKAPVMPPVLPDTDAETPFDGPVSGAVPRAPVDNSPVNVAPRGDGVAALAALGHSSKRCTDIEQTANIARAHKLMQKSKDKDVLALAAFVLDWFEITVPVCAEDNTD